MKYMLLIYADEQAWPYPEREECFAESTQLAQQLSDEGHYLAAAPLQPSSTATSIRVRDGKPLVTVPQSRFARPACAHDRDEFSAINLQAYVGQCANRLVTEPVLLVDMVESDERSHALTRQAAPI